MTSGEAPCASAFTLLFGAVARCGPDVLALIEALPRLCGGALDSCQVGASSTVDLCVCRGRCHTPLGDESAARLQFWAWCQGGTASFGEEQDAGVLEACDRVVREVAPGRAADRERLLGLLVPDGAAPGALVLRVDPLGAGGAGLLFDRRGQSLFVASPRSPPEGDPVPLRIRRPEGGTLSALGVVRRYVRAGQGGPGSPAGLLLGLVNPGADVLEVLEHRAGERLGRGDRRSPRCPVCLPVGILAPQGGSACAGADEAPVAQPGAPRIANLSQGGALVRGAAPRAPGSRVALWLRAPDGGEITLSGVVVHSGAQGMGIRLEAGGETQERLGHLLEQAALRRRRALVVDDDRLYRELIGDALAGQGFEVFGARDGVEGIRRLIDLLMGLDLLVLDLHMPGVDGERLLELVRGKGGERDLTIAVAAGDLDAQTRARLMAAGADVALPKSAGVQAIVEAAVEALLRREGAPGAGGCAG